MLHKRRTLPEHARVAELQRQRDEIAERLVQTDTRVSDLELAQRKAEADLEPVRERRTRDQQRIDDGSVADPRALSAMIEEVQHLTRRIGDLEDAELEVMEALEQAQGEQAELREQQAAAEAELADVVRHRDEQVRAIDASGSELKAERAALVPLLPPDLVSLYEKLRATRSGSGAAALRHRRCLGCQIEANAADLRAYAAAPADAVLRCEECGRILIRTAESGI